MTAMEIFVIALVPVSALGIGAWLLYINRAPRADRHHGTPAE